MRNWQCLVTLAACSALRRQQDARRVLVGLGVGFVWSSDVHVLTRQA